MDISLNLIKVNRILDIDFYSGSISLGELMNRYKVPVYRPNIGTVDDPKSGYQREAKVTRITAVKNRISNPNNLTQLNTEPFMAAVNLNLRDEDALKNLKPKEDGKNGYGDFFEFSYLDSFGDFYIVDGQTRIKGALEAANIDSNPQREEILKLRVPITLTITKNVFKEAYTFVMINKYAKPIPSDAAYRILASADMAEDEKFKMEIEQQGLRENISSYKIANRLNEESVVWANMLNDFNEVAMKLSARKKGNASINSMATSIEKIYSRLLRDADEVIDDKLKGKLEERIMQQAFLIIEAYWSGFQLAFPDIFKEVDGKKVYSIYKSGPSEIMMILLDKLIENKIRYGKLAIITTLTDKDKYKYIFSRSIPEVTDYDMAGNQVTGNNIFKAGKQGSIGKHSNNSAKVGFAGQIFAIMENNTKGK